MDAVGAPRVRLRLLALVRGARPARPRRQRGERRGGRLHARDDLRPLPPLDRPPGSERLRLERDRRDREATENLRSARASPARYPHPPGDHRPGGGDVRSAAAGTLLPRARNGREPERARHSGTAGRRRTSGSRCSRRRSRSSGCSGRAASRPTAAATTPSITRRSTRFRTSRRRSRSPPRSRLRPRSRAGSATARHDRSLAELVEAYRAAGGTARATARSSSAGPRTKTRRRRPSSSSGRPPRSAARMNQELPRPSDFESAVEGLHEEKAVAGTPCGPDPEPVLEQIRSGSRPASTTSPPPGRPGPGRPSSASGARSLRPQLG